MAGWVIWPTLNFTEDKHKLFLNCAFQNFPEDETQIIPDLWTFSAGMSRAASPSCSPALTSTLHLPASAQREGGLTCRIPRAASPQLRCGRGLGLGTGVEGPGQVRRGRDRSVMGSGQVCEGLGQE